MTTATKPTSLNYLNDRYHDYTRILNDKNIVLPPRVYDTCFLGELDPDITKAICKGVYHYMDANLYHFLPDHVSMKLTVERLPFHELHHYFHLKLFLIDETTGEVENPYPMHIPLHPWDMVNSDTFDAYLDYQRIRIQS